MLDLYFWTTPNGYKPMLFLEEAGIPYEIVPVDISKGAQFEPNFLKISPNNRIPALVDRTPEDMEGPLALFESGEILLYLTEKYGKFLPTTLRGRHETLQWLFWQMGGLGPMLGQNHHFSTYAPEKIPYAIERYVKETARLYAVLNKQLEGRDFISGDYSIADMACYPWVVLHERQSIDLADFPNIARWYAAIWERPATKRAYEKGKAINTAPTVSEEAKKILFGQGAEVIKKG
ncbi:MAG: glutathione S-transferase N-terminal domain-containing protein [Rhodospirillales bacterium]|nr:glutathione S-transferase N-terminal domain-containing protein [Rhodospirillales bacterium]